MECSPVLLIAISAYKFQRELYSNYSMSVACDHFQKIKLICLYQGCESSNILMCNSCFYNAHCHPTSPCVRVDYLEQTMAPYIRISERKQGLEEELVKAIEEKKTKMIEYMDNQAKLIKEKYLDKVEVPELALFNVLKQDTISNEVQPMIKATLANDHGIGLEANYQRLEELRRVIDRIGESYNIVNIQEESNKRPHSGVNPLERQLENKKKRKVDKTCINIDDDSPPKSLEAPLMEQIVSPAVNKSYQYTNFVAIEDCKDEEEINEQVTVKCDGFEQAIRELEKRKKVQIFKIQIEASNKAQPKKYCSTFFENLQNLKFIQLLDLKIGKSFLMYDFICDNLVKSLGKLNYLKELYLQFTTKSDLKEYLMPKFEKKLMRKNIHLTINKLDVFA